MHSNDLTGIRNTLEQWLITVILRVSGISGSINTLTRILNNYGIILAERLGIHDSINPKSLKEDFHHEKDGYFINAGCNSYIFYELLLHKSGACQAAP